MDERLKEYLRQIAIGSQDAIDFVVGMDYAAFLLDLRTQRAIAMSLVIVGEASSKIAERFPAFVVSHSEISWADIRGMRNRIAHDYFDLNFAVIWNTVKSELPVLLLQVNNIIEQQP